jgi:hypothetical protein
MAVGVFPQRLCYWFQQGPLKYLFYCTVIPDRFIHFAHFFRLKSGIFEKNALSKLKSLCFGDSEHIFKFKIVQVFPKKNAFKPYAEFMIYIYSTVQYIAM